MTQGLEDKATKGRLGQTLRTVLQGGKFVISYKLFTLVDSIWYIIGRFLWTIKFNNSLFFCSKFWL